MAVNGKYVKSVEDLNASLILKVSKIIYIHVLQHYAIFIFRYFKVLVQEMQVKVDQGFLNNVLDLFSADQEISSTMEVSMSHYITIVTCTCPFITSVLLVNYS